MVGIFWMAPDLSCFFYSEQIEINNAILYGDWLISKNDHVDIWEILKGNGDLKSLGKRYHNEYWLLPRGRVSYNIKSQLYYVYHGNWFKENHTEMIYERYSIHESNSIFEYDQHYS